MGSSFTQSVSDNSNYLATFAALGAAGVLGVKAYKNGIGPVQNMFRKTLDAVSTPLSAGAIAALGTAAMYPASHEISKNGFPFKSEENATGNRMIALASFTFLLTAILVNPLKRIFTANQHSKLGVLAISTTTAAASLHGVHKSIQSSHDCNDIALYTTKQITNLSKGLSKLFTSKGEISHEKIQAFWSDFDFLRYEDESTLSDELVRYFSEKWSKKYGERFNERVAKDLGALVAAMPATQSGDIKYHFLHGLSQIGKSKEQLTAIFNHLPKGFSDCLEIELRSFQMPRYTGPRVDLYQKLRDYYSQEHSYKGWANPGRPTPFKKGFFPAGYAGVAAALAMVSLGVLKHVTYRALPTAIVVAPIMTFAKYKTDTLTRESSERSKRIKRTPKNIKSTRSKCTIAAFACAIIGGTVIVPKLSSMVLKNCVGYLEAFAQSLVGTAAVFAAQVCREDQE